MNGTLACLISVVATILSKTQSNILFWIFVVTTIVQIYSWGIMHNFTYTKKDYDNMPQFAIILNLVSSIIEWVLYVVLLVCWLT